MKFLTAPNLPEAISFIEPKPLLTARGWGETVQERRAAWDELWTATDSLQSMRDNANARGRAMQEAYKARNAAILDATGEDPAALSKDQRRALLQAAGPDADIETATATAYRQRLRDIAARHPDKADIIRADVPIEDDAKALAQRSEQAAAAAARRAEAAGLPAGARFGASLGGGFRAMMRDPVQVGTLMLGAGPATARTVAGKVLQTVFTEAIVNGGVEAVVQAASHKWKQDAGLDASVGTALEQIGLAAAFGGGFGGLLEGGRAAIGALSATVPETVLQQAVSGEPAAIRAVAEALQRPLSEPEARLLDSAAAAQEMDSAAFGADIEARPSQAAAALDAIEADAPLPPRPKPVPAPRPEPDARRLLDAMAPAPQRVAQPVHLNRFLANQGGIVDHGGELKSLDAHKLFIPGSGKLVTLRGKSLDYAREAAAEAGYFDHLYGDPETAVALSTVDDLLQAIDSDMRGQRIYAGKDAGKADAAAAAAEQADYRNEIRTKLQAVLDIVEGTLPDALIRRATELHVDGEPPDAALERAIIEDYNRDLPDVPLEKDDGSAFEIPFFDDGERLPSQRAAAAGGRQESQAGPGKSAVEARGQAGPAGQAQGPAETGVNAYRAMKDGDITPDTLRPPQPVEPATPQAADMAALALTEARRGGWIIVNRQTSEAVFETTDRAKVAALNTDKYTAVPVQDYLVEFNRRTKAEGGQPQPQPWSIAAPAEQTDAGLQVLIPGVGEVTLKQTLDLKAAKPMRGGNAAPGGLFDDTVTKQVDIMDMMPAGTDAEGRTLHVSHADLIAEADRKDFFGDLIASCKD